MDLVDEPQIMQKFIDSNYDINLVVVYADQLVHDNVSVPNLPFLQDNTTICQQMTQQTDLFNHLGSKTSALGCMALHAPSPYHQLALHYYQLGVENLKKEQPPKRPICSCHKITGINCVHDTFPNTTHDITSLSTFLILQSVHGHTGYARSLQIHPQTSLN